MESSMTSITKIGTSHGVILDKLVLAQSGLQPGDEVAVGIVPGGVIIAAKSSRQGKIITAMNESMTRNADVYRALAAS